jgi:YidC/Oxa1 family membrane protein insertase
MLVLANIFQPLIDFFEAILKFFHDTVGVGWGMSIILMTVVIRAALVPLTLKQMHSMQRLQQLQPQIKALQAKYKDDKQRMNQEMMRFYQENKVNPFSSCLPMVLQLPVFISLFFMLRHDLRTNICPAIQKAAHSGTLESLHGKVLSAGKTTPCGAGHGAGFLFIHDLTDKATGTVLIVLIVLYVASQLASSLMMTTTMDKMQRNLMLFLPLIFVTFVIRFPAGLIVYWITTNLWTVGQQYFVKKRVGPLQPAATAGGGGGGDSGGQGGLSGLLGGGRGGGGGLSGFLERAAGRSADRGAGDGDGGARPKPAGKAAGTKGTAASPKGTAASPKGTAASPKGKGGSTKGKTTSNGASAEDRRSSPPPPPRKKKKRSGRRR